MWNNYPDKVSYEKKTEEDSFGGGGHGSPKTVYMRLVSGRSVSKVNDNVESIEKGLMYHSPFEVFEGDKINGRTVVEKPIPSRGPIGNKIEFWRAKVK